MTGTNVTGGCAVTSRRLQMNSRGRELLTSSVIWDNHGCMPLRIDGDFLPQLERYREAGVTVASINIGFADIPWTDHLRVLSFMRRWISQRPATYRLISSVDDVYQCKQDGKLGVTFDVEGMSPVAENIHLVQTFYELGVRWMLIAYNRNNAAGGGCLDTEDGGLTDTGRSIIDEMERVGMVLCLSHAGARTAVEALDYSRNPPIFSHSNPFGDNPHPRNISDDLMRACARKGGVVGLSGIGPFLGTNGDLVDHLLRQLRYVIDLIGTDHVGLGLDYVFDRTELEQFVSQNPSLFPTGVGDGMRTIEPEAFESIAEGLAKSNFTDSQILGVLGDNWLRIARRVWQ
jgi:membrane dipeptidase